ncbi:hypothetical protein PHLCEN_2v9562 [Hermanssonia centrifuga]|uniref:Uncharacterized protein n=1 Tax=Hermanssonia centrifuga TaxID=98765 RepID=A0A2R6NQD9_9APHY|nr:hypothetical protein PHLCEN_2v9562 [Hermanssonia centrifuga]
MADWLLSKALSLNEQNPDVLLQKMTEAARISLDNSYLNCGCYHDLPWINSLRRLHLRKIHPQSVYSLIDVLDQFKFINTSPSHPLEYSDLLDESGKVVAVITGEGVKEDYEKAKAKIRENLDWMTEDLAGGGCDVGEGVIVIVDDHPHPCITPGDDGPSEGTDQEEGEVGVVLDAIIPSSESEPAHKGVSTEIPTMAAIKYAGQMQTPAKNGEHAEDDTSPPMSRSTHPSASTDERASDPRNPLSGQFEGVGSAGVHDEQTGIDSEEGIEGIIRRDVNGRQIEMQEMSTMSRTEVH